jgi:hypothetical protein
MRLNDCQQHAAYQITGSNIPEENKHPFICMPAFGICYYTLGIVNFAVSKVK